MVDIIHRVGIKAPISKVYEALSTVAGVAAWWATETTGESKVGGTVKAVFRRPDGENVGSFEWDVLKLTLNKEVHWRFTAGPAEWIGTDVIFALSQDGDYTVVLFGHKNWREAVEFMAHCSTKWATFLLSLRDLLETGTGRPAPNDLKISNWH